MNVFKQIQEGKPSDYRRKCYSGYGRGSDKKCTRQYGGRRSTCKSCQDYLEKAYCAGKIRVIRISNFYVDHMIDLYH
jgi:diketogulonate reductase-like aldo/keto reductase